MIEAKEDRIVALGQLGVLKHSCSTAEPCCTGASPEEVELEVEVAEPEFVVVAAGLERAYICLRSQSLRNRRLAWGPRGLRRSLGILSKARIGVHCSHLLICSGALSSGNQLLLLGPGEVQLE